MQFIRQPSSYQILLSVKFGRKYLDLEILFPFKNFFVCTEISYFQKDAASLIYNPMSITF